MAEQQSDRQIKRRKRTPLADRFWAKVDRSEGDDACWLWTGAKSAAGYGQIYTEDRQKEYAHRISYEMHAAGRIPDGLYACHACDTPACVNPKHLWLGKIQDNHADMMSKGRNSRGEAHPGTKLKEQQVRAIRTDSRSDLAVAKDYGLSQSQVTRIKNRQRWKHI